MPTVYLVGLTVLLGLSFKVHALFAQCKVQGEHLIVEAYYDDDMPAQEAKIEVVDASNNVIASGKTDDKGVFRTKRPPAGKYTVRVDAGAGHQCKVEANIPATGDGKASPKKPGTGVKESTERTQVVSSGPTREDVRQIPWSKVGLGLFIIVMVCTVLWIVTINLKSRQTQGDGQKP
jgi:hypothetical protein